jgi:hypothetical protein
VSISLTRDFQQQGIVVTIDQHRSDAQAIPRRFPLHPERVARAAEEGGVPRGARAVEGFLVHEAHHQHFRRFVVLNNGGNQSVEFRKIHGHKTEKPCRMPAGLGERFVENGYEFTRTSAGPLEQE